MLRLNIAEGGRPESVCPSPCCPSRSISTDGAKDRPASALVEASIRRGVFRTGDVHGSRLSQRGCRGVNWRTWLALEVARALGAMLLSGSPPSMLTPPLAPRSCRRFGSLPGTRPGSRAPPRSWRRRGCFRHRIRRRARRPSRIVQPHYGDWWNACTPPRDHPLVVAASVADARMLGTSEL